MSAKLVINTFRANVKTKSETLGNIELKYISVGDIEFYEKNFAKVREEKEFVYRVIHHQLVIPDIAYTKLIKITEDELRKIARDFVKYEKYTFKYFKETTDDEFFCNFRRAIQKRVDEEQKRIKKLFTPIRSPLETLLKTHSGIIGQLQSASSPLSRLVRESTQLTRLIKNSQYSLIERMRPAILQIQTTSDLIEKALKPQIGFWEKWVDQSQRIFEKFNDHRKQFYDSYKISEQQAVKILRKYKLFITPSMPIAFVFEVVKIGSRRGNHRGEINRLFVGFFCSNDYKKLEALVNGWESNAIFKPRMKIFRDCLDGLRNASRKSNPSNFILPTLIAQIDGILQEYIEKHGCVKKKKWKEFYRKIAPNQDMDELANEIFLNILFQKAYRGTELDIPFTFNRHKIIHGEYLRYGRIDNTIRAFLILDFLASLN